MSADDNELFWTANSQSIQSDLDKVHQWSVRWNVSSNLGIWQRLMGGGANSDRHMS